MLPKFPSFKRLELSDKADIEKITNQFPPYSDFNFTSLWCWDTHDQILISELHNNLVVKFTDYQSLEPFYSFIGINDVDNTVVNLLNLAKKEEISMQIKLLPEETIKFIDKTKFQIEEDIDNFDYILPIQNLSTYAGKKLGPKRNFVNRFIKNNNISTHLLNISDNKIKNEINKICSKWALENEHKAIMRVFERNKADLIAIGIYIGSDLIAFTINEVLNDKYGILHFEKGDTETYIGIFPFLMQETAKVLLNKKIQLLNYEQDLGITGLRQSKKSYYPAQYLKNYILSKK